MSAEDSCGCLRASRTKERRLEMLFFPQDGAIQSPGEEKRSESGRTEVGRLGICIQEAEGSECWRPWV